MKQGALIHKKDRNGDPPLVCAVLANNLEVVRLLVQVRDPFPQYVCVVWFGGLGYVRVSDFGSGGSPSPFHPNSAW